MPVLLAAATEEFHVFGDGSFQQFLQLGAWAYRIPQLELEGRFCATGCFSEEFELRAIVAGLRRLADVDRTTRPVRVFSDSQFVQAVVRHLSQKAAPPRGKSLARVRYLYDEATALVDGRRVVSEKASLKQDDHRRCHLNALATLRDAIRREPAYLAYLSLAQEEQRRHALRSQRAQLDKQLEAIEHELLLSEVRISAMRQGLCGVNGSSADQKFAGADETGTACLRAQE